MKKWLLFLLLGLMLPVAHAESAWQMGFASRELTYEDLNRYYIAGYTNGAHPTEIRDAQRVSAAYLSDGEKDVLLISVDCVALDSGTVAQIRADLGDFDAVYVAATHTHAGVDTLGLWGPVGQNGKDVDFMQQLVRAAIEAGRAARTDARKGSLYFSETQTEGMLRDSRNPQVMDETLYQWRFVPEDGTPGVRVAVYGAHAEALRGANRRISRDFPGVLADVVQEASGDRLLFLPGAVGGLVMTRAFSEDAEENLCITGDKLAAYVLHPGEEEQLNAALRIARADMTVPMENTLFLYYKFLGILNSHVQRDWRGYTLQTEVCLLDMGGVTLALLPGEMFPETVADLRQIAAEKGVTKLVIAGLCNDEIGYIVPESDFLLDEAAPYVQGAPGHYEETNAVGPQVEEALALALAQAAEQLAP